MAKTGQPQTEKVQGRSASFPAGFVSGQQSGKSEKQGFLRGAISVFILVHLIAITCWGLPIDFSPVKNVKEFMRPYIVWSGLFQSWDFFAPNPKRTNSYIEAVVLTQSHQQKVWVFPRMEHLGYFERYREERYRKFAEVLPDRKCADLWPDVAKHTEQMFSSRTDPPEAVLLIEFQAPIQLGTELVPKPNIFYEYVDSVPLEEIK